MYIIIIKQYKSNSNLWKNKTNCSNFSPNSKLVEGSKASVDCISCYIGLHALTGSGTVTSNTQSQTSLQCGKQTTYMHIRTYNYTNIHKFSKHTTQMLLKHIENRQMNKTNGIGNGVKLASGHSLYLDCTSVRDQTSCAHAPVTASAGCSEL